MKLTNRTIPQARNYQCDLCKRIFCHKDMRDDTVCYDCFGNKSTASGEEVASNYNAKVRSTSNPANVDETDSSFKGRFSEMRNEKLLK